MVNAPEVKFSLQEIADPRTLSLLEKVNLGLANLLGAIKSIRLEIPNPLNIRGRVTVDKIEDLPPVNIQNLSEIRPYFEVLDRGLIELQNSIVKALAPLNNKQAKDSKSSVTVDNVVKIEGIADLLDSFEELKKGFNLLLNAEDGSPAVKQVEVTNFPIPKIPQPVTSVDIKGLRGFAKSRTVTVGASTPAPLPGEILSNRRSMVLYNADASATLYVGGSDVTAANGMPVPAGTYSPAFDASPQLVVYGISSSGNIDIRTLEMSNENIGA